LISDDEFFFSETKVIEETRYDEDALQKQIDSCIAKGAAHHGKS
jgi:hypothetical protein